MQCFRVFAGNQNEELVRPRFLQLVPKRDNRQACVYINHQRLRGYPYSPFPSLRVPAG